MNKTFTNSMLIGAKDCSRKNRDSLARSVSCGCYNCVTIFLANDIRDWKQEDDRNLTALCPYCNEETVIGDDAVYPMKKDFLRAMNAYWIEKC